MITIKYSFLIDESCNPVVTEVLFSLSLSLNLFCENIILAKFFCVTIISSQIGIISYSKLWSVTIDLFLSILMRKQDNYS